MYITMVRVAGPCCSFNACANRVQWGTRSSAALCVGVDAAYRMDRWRRPDNRVPAPASYCDIAVARAWAAIRGTGSEKG